MGTTAQKLQAILDSKADIKSAIESKDVEVGNAPLDEYGDNDTTRSLKAIFHYIIERNK